MQSHYIYLKRTKCKINELEGIVQFPNAQFDQHFTSQIKKPKGKLYIPFKTYNEYSTFHVTITGVTIVIIPLHTLVKSFNNTKTQQLTIFSDVLQRQNKAEMILRLQKKLF